MCLLFWRISFRAQIYRKLISYKEENAALVNDLIKEFLEPNYPRGRAIGVFRWFHFDLRGKNRNSVFRFPLMRENL